nr:retrotransposon Orf1 [Tanacetum cinerariifolium]
MITTLESCLYYYYDGEGNPIRTLGDYSKPSYEGYRNTIELPVGNKVVPLRSDTIQLVQNGCSFHGLRFEDPNQHLKDFLKLVDLLDLDCENKERTRLHLFQFSLRDQASNWLELVPMILSIAGKIPSKLLLNTHPRVPMKRELSEGLVSNFMASQDVRLSKFEADFKQQQSEMTNKINKVLKAITDRIAGALPSDTVRNPKLSTFLVLPAHSYPIMNPQCLNHIYSSINADTIYQEKQSDSYDDREKENEEEEKDMPKKIHANPSTPPDPSVSFITEKVLKLNSFFESLGLVPQSSDTEVIYIKGSDGEVMFIEIIRKNDDSHEEGPKEEGSTTTEGVGVEYFDIFPTRSKLEYHKYRMCGPIPSIFLRNPIIMEGCPSNLKIPCNIRHVHVEKAYIDPNTPLNIMNRMMYNWIMRRKLNPRENSNRGVSNFTRRIKGMHVFVGNFTYVIDFLIVKDISSIIDPRLSQVVLGRPFVEISNMTIEPPEGVIRFTNKTNEVTYKMPHKIEQYNSLSDLEKEHT